MSIGCPAPNAGPESPQPDQGGEQLLRRHRAVPDRRRRQAGIAVPARIRPGLAEVRQHLPPPAARRLAQGEHRVQVRHEPAAVREVAVGVVDHPPLLHHVRQPVGQPGRGRRPVAPGPPGLLVIPLDRPGQVEVRDEAHVRLVDAHPERDRGHHDQPVLAQEPRLVHGPGPRVEAGVVGQRDEAFRGQELGRLLHRRPGQAVDDARVTRVLGPQQPEQLPPRFILRLDPVLDVGPVEARHELPGLA